MNAYFRTFASLGTLLSLAGCLGQVDSSASNSNAVSEEPGAPAPIQVPPPAPADPQDVWLAFDTQGGGDKAIYVMRADGSERRKLDLGRSAGAPAFSPIGNELAFASDDGIWIKNLNTGASRQLTHDTLDSVPTWSRDGKRIAFTRDLSVAMIDVDGKNEHMVAVGPPPGNAWYGNYGHPAFAGDGKTLLFGKRGGIDRSEFDGGNLEALFVTGEQDIAFVGVSPDGVNLAIWSNCGLRTVPFGQASDVCTAGKLLRSGYYAMGRPAWGANGLIAFADDLYGVSVVAVDGSADTEKSILNTKTDLAGEYVFEVAWSQPGTVMP